MPDFTLHVRRILLLPAGSQRTGAAVGPKPTYQNWVLALHDTAHAKPTQTVMPQPSLLGLRLLRLLQHPLSLDEERCDGKDRNQQHNHSREPGDQTDRRSS